MLESFITQKMLCKSLPEKLLKGVSSRNAFKAYNSLNISEQFSWVSDEMPSVDTMHFFFQIGRSNRTRYKYNPVCFGEYLMSCGCVNGCVCCDCVRSPKLREIGLYGSPCICCCPIGYGVDTIIFGLPALP